MMTDSVNFAGSLIFQAYPDIYSDRRKEDFFSYMKKQEKTIILLLCTFIISGLLLCFDQYTKGLAVARLKGQAPFVLIDRVLEFNYLENTGAAFSSFSGKQTFLILLTTLVILLVIWKYLTLPADRRFLGMRLCLLLIVSGAVGNLIDRLKNRYVVDFIYFVPINFPKFNVADIYITVGVALLAALLFFFYTEEELDCLFRMKP